MKNLRLIFYLIIAFCFAIHSSAQFENPVIEFEEEIYDFGEIDESGGPVIHNFNFINSGFVPLIINDVKTSCGCTTPEWTKEPIMPGQMGSIKVLYNPRSRPGPFNKSVTIKSNAEKSSVILRIKGTVITTKKDDLTDNRINYIKTKYRARIGDLRLKNPHVAFNEMMKGETKKQVIDVANGSKDTPIKISFSSIPDFLEINVKPEILNPAEEGTIEITFKSADINEWDRIIHRLHVLVNDERPDNNVLTVTAIINEDFSKLTPRQLEKAPQIYIESKTFSFGNIKQGKKIEHDFILKNTGQSDLLIRRVWATCGCTAVEPKKNIIPPGRSTQIKTIFNTAGRTGNQKKMITVITNDPKNPKIILWIEGNIEP